MLVLSIAIKAPTSRCRVRVETHDFEVIQVHLFMIGSHCPVEIHTGSPCSPDLSNSLITHDQ
jgi:hypothetical protein